MTTRTMKRPTKRPPAKKPGESTTRRDAIVRAALQDLGINLSDFAERIKMSPQALFSALVTAKPHSKTLQKLADGLTAVGKKTSPSDLV